MGIAVFTLALAGLLFILVALPGVLQGQGSLDDLASLSANRLSNNTTPQVDDLQLAVDKVHGHIIPTARLLIWIGRFSPSLKWIPGLGSTAASWGIQGDRIIADLEAAKTLVPAGDRLLRLQTKAFELLDNFRIGNSVDTLIADSTDLKTDFKSSIEKVTQSIAIRDSMWPSLNLSGSSSLTTRMERLEDQILVASDIGFMTSDLIMHILKVREAANPVLSQFYRNSEGFEELSVDIIEEHVLLIDMALEDAITALTELQTSLALYKVTERELSTQIDMTRDLLSALSEVNAATALLLTVVEPMMSSQGEEWSIFGENGRLSVMLDSAESRSDSFLIAANRLNKARVSLTASRSDIQNTDWIEDITGLIQTLEDGLSFIGEFAPVANAVLKADEPTKFLMLGQSADEIRATGGFVSSIWLLTFQDGDLQDVRYHDAVRVDDWERLILYPPAPFGLEHHMNAHVWLLRDVSWEPDFPTTARTAKDMFKIGQRQNVDGVVAITQWAFLELVNAIDWIPSPTGEEPITSRNLLTKLEKGTDEFGRAYMDVALQGVLDRLKQPTSLSTLIKLSSAIRNTLDTRELLLYFEDTDLQASISEMGWDGRIKSGPSDYLYVVDSNVGWSKSDRNIKRDITYNVDLTRETGPRINLMLGYNNFSAAGSVGCEPQWLNRGTDYAELKNACYWNYLRVYMPLESKLRDSTRLDLPEYSVAAEIGRGLPGEDTIRTYSSFDKRVVAGLFPLAAGEQTDINIVYDLPIEILQHDNNSISYKLLVQKQPGIRQRNISVKFSLPIGYYLEQSSIDPVSSNGSKVTFAFPSTRDILLTADFTNAQDEPN